jgi:uncharacterized phage protein (TIGR02220 family)
LRWAWAAFGCYTKQHGTNGRIELVNTRNGLAAVGFYMGVQPEHVLQTLKMLPHISVEECGKSPGTIVGTWANWYTYQVDSSSAQRKMMSRSKRRGEEIRGDQKRTAPLPPVDSVTLNDSPPEPDPICQDCLTALSLLNELTCRTYDPDPAVLAQLHTIHPRYGLDRVLAVIRDKVQEWSADPRMHRWLRPATLFDRGKFDGYVNALTGPVTQRPVDDTRPAVFAVGRTEEEPID